MQTYGCSRLSGLDLHSSTALNAFSLRLETVPAETPAPPQGLADVLDAPRGHAGQMHLDDGLLDAGLAPFVALDDGGRETHSFELGHSERDLARRRGEPALAVPGAVRRPLVGALVRTRAREPVGLLVEHGVDGLLDGFPDQLAKLGLHRLLVE